jgi:hypothetical protein
VKEEEEEDNDQSLREWSSIEQVSFYLNKAANVSQRTSKNPLACWKCMIVDADA